MNDSQSNTLTQSGGLTNQNVQQGLFADSRMNDLIAQVQQGKMSIDDAQRAFGQGGGPASGSAAGKAANDQIMRDYITRQGGNGIAAGNAAVAQNAMTNDPGYRQAEFRRQLALNPTSGGLLASQDVMNNPLFSKALGQEQDQLKTGQSLFNDQSGRLTNMQNQGFQLTPEDQTLYGQTSGNIARMFGQQGNQAASNLAMRGMSNSGAAGATFSGIQGNQNEMLAQAQQQIMQQRFQNTQNQISQQQQFMGQLNSQNNAMAGQYANTAGQYQNQAYNQNLGGIQQQQAEANDNAKNSNDYQSLQQNENNEQFSQRQATSAGSAIGSAMGALGTLAQGAGAVGSMFGKGGGTASSGTMGAGGATQLPGTNPNAPNYYGPVK